MRIARYFALSGFLFGWLVSAPLILTGCSGGSGEGTLVERTPEQVAGEKASMKGMMEAMKSKAKRK